MEALAFPSLASLVVLISEVGAGRAALPTSRSNECCRIRLMGNRFPQCGRALWAGRAVRACVPAWEGGRTHPTCPKHPAAPPRLLLPFAPASNVLLTLLPRDQGPHTAALSTHRGLKLVGKAEQGGGEQSWALRGA